ncbi:ribosomal protein L15 [Gigaspora margarita]|uniref:Ribosomal protein L15 n=1 Tax=Gigaspora margarita TaxID=4874 RepID=A0A8H4A239_GIGMA|nr:ribosomal protein L15 [Gigaspora margarita]
MHSILKSTCTTFRTYVTILQKPRILLGLGNLSDNPGATKQRKRVGRGPASGHGKTCGRGQKGQKARGGNGKPRRGFEGGQTSISVAFPKRGFHNRNEKTYAPLNLDRLQHWINTGRIDPSQTITMKHLLDTRCVHGVKDGVKLLADGSHYFKTPIKIEVARASQTAIKAIEKAGGNITCRYYNRLALRATIKPEKFWKIPKFAAPVKAKDIEWYSNYKNRGYLSKKLAGLPVTQANAQMAARAI